MNYNHNILRNQPKVSDYIFPNKYGNPLNDDYVSRMFKEAVKEVGIQKNIKYHNLRHTFASWAISGGMPVYALKQVLGHSSVVTTGGLRTVS